MAANPLHIELNRPKNVKKAMPELGAMRSDGWRVAPDQLHFLPEFNARQKTAEYDAHIETLTQSMMVNGFYASKPIEVIVQDEDGTVKLYVTDGHSRTEAAKRAILRGAPLETVPVVAKPEGTTLEDITIGLITNNEGKPFNTYEKSEIIKRLVDMGLDVKIIAKRLGYTAPYVSDLLTLASAPKKIREMVAAEQVSPTAAIKEIADHGPKVATERLTEGLKTAQAAGKGKLTPKHLPKPAKKAPVAKLVGTMAGGSKGKIIINFDMALTHGFSVGDKVKIVLLEKDEI